MSRAVCDVTKARVGYYCINGIECDYSCMQEHTNEKHNEIRNIIECRRKKVKVSRCRKAVRTMKFDNGGLLLSANTKKKLTYHVNIGMVCHATTDIHCLKQQHIFREGVSKHAVKSQGVAGLRFCGAETLGGPRTLYAPQSCSKVNRRPVDALSAIFARVRSNKAGQRDERDALALSNQSGAD